MANRRMHRPSAKRVSLSSRAPFQMSPKKPEPDDRPRPMSKGRRKRLAATRI